MRQENKFRAIKFIAIFLGLLSLLFVTLVFLLLHTFNELLGSTRMFMFNGSIIFLLVKYTCFLLAVFRPKIGAIFWLITLILEIVLIYILSGFETLQISLLLRLNAPMYVTVILFYISSLYKNKQVYITKA